MISHDTSEYDNLEYGIPYVIGTMTRNKFVRLEPFQDLMASLDPEGEKIKNDRNRNSDKIFQYYRTEWANVIKKSSKMIRDTMAKTLATHKVKHAMKSEPGPLYPYRPFTDRGPNHVFSEYDVLWSTSLLCKPGK